MAHHSIHRGLVLIFLGALLYTPNGGWGIPLQINEQGVVQVGDQPFEGTGVFRFALVDAVSGNNLWTNDGSALGGTGTPTAGVSLPVESGIYHVRLGDDSLANMTPIGSEVFDTDFTLLKIWFDDGVNGVQPLAPSAGITSVPYAYRSLRSDFALDADTVDGADAAALEESAEIDADVGAHNADPAAHPNIQLDGARIVSGKIANARLNTGAGNGLDADSIDSLDSSQLLRRDIDNAAAGTLTILGDGKKLISQATAGDEATGEVSKIEVRNSLGVALFFVDEDGDLVATTLSGDGSQIINLNGANIATGKIANARLNTGAGNGLDADTVDGAHAAALEESAEIDGDVSAHDTNPNAHANIQLDGARIATGKIANARLNTGSGNGLDSDSVDALQASQFLRSDADDIATGAITFEGTAKKLMVKATAADESTGNVTKIELQNSAGNPLLVIDEDGDVTGASFTGNGSGLNGLVGTNVTTGTIAEARIAATIHRDNELKLVQNVGVAGTTLNEFTSPTDSGAALIGVFDELTHSNATNLQDALDDMDSAITGASGLQGLFETIDAPSGTDPEADDPNDTLQLLNGPGINIVGDQTVDSLTVGVLADGINGEQLADFFTLDNHLTLSGPFDVAVENSQAAGQFLLDFSNDTPTPNQKFFAISKGTAAPTEIFSVDEDGDVAGASFTGNGAGLTSLNGTQITTGTVADARIAATLARDSEVTSGVDTHNNDPGAHPNIALDGARITSGKIANARLNTGGGNGLDADTVDGAHAAALEESAEIDADIATHNSDANAHPNIALDGARITSGKIANARLNTGAGNGLDSDLLDGIQSSQFLRSDEDDTTSGTLSVIGTAKKLFSRATAADESTGNVPKLEVQNSASAALFTVDEDGDVTAASVSGNGAGLTALNGSQVTTGTVADARIAASVARDSEVTSAIGTHNNDANAHPNIALDGARITSGKIANARLNTGSGNGLDADTVDGAHAAALEESAEIDSDISTHNNDANAHPNIALDGARITSGKIANARLNTGSGNGLDADTVDGKHASDLQPKFVRIVVVSPIPGGAVTANGTALLNALNGITDNSSTNPYLIKIEPGIYDLGALALNMKTFVDVEGSGEAVTTITSTGPDTIVLTGNSTLRDVTVGNTGAGARAAVNSTSSFVRAERVTVSTTANASVRGFQTLAGGYFRDITVLMSGSARMVGGVKCMGGVTTVEGARLICDTALAKGIVLDGASSVIVRNCDVQLSAGDSIAIESLINTTLEVYGSVLKGGTSLDLSGTTGRFAHTQFIGTRSGTAITYAHCFANTTFTPITNTLAAIP